MTELRLNIEALKYPAFVADKPSEYSSIDWKLFLILQDFLQPENTSSISDVANRVVNVLLDSSHSFRSVNDVCFELAEQIPYNHPSQLKLVRMLWLVGRDEKRILKYDDKNKSSAFNSFYQQLSEDIVDNRRFPSDGEYSPARYYNFQAFLANLMDAGLWVPGASDALLAMRGAFERDHSAESPEIRDAWTIGAAQWIIWYGQGLYKLILLPEDGQVERLTREGWRAWRKGFEVTVNSDEAGDECKGVATRAIRLMDAIDLGMG